MALSTNTGEPTCPRARGSRVRARRQRRKFKRLCGRHGTVSYTHLAVYKRQPYDIFVQKGVVTLSGENYVDYKDVYNWFVMLKEKYEIYVLKVGYDRYSAQYLIDDMAAYGFHMDDVFQGENLAGVIREFEGILLDGNFKIPDNSLLKSHFLNVALKHNMETRKFRPVKIEQRARIDGFVSVIDAMTVRQKYYNEIGVMLKNAG